MIHFMWNIIVMAVDGGWGGGERMRPKYQSPWNENLHSKQRKVSFVTPLCSTRISFWGKKSALGNSQVGVLRGTVERAFCFSLSLAFGVTQPHLVLPVTTVPVTLGAKSHLPNNIGSNRQRGVISFLTALQVALLQSFPFGFLQSSSALTPHLPLQEDSGLWAGAL